MAYATLDDLYKRISQTEALKLADDIYTDSDRRDATVTKFICQTADTSGRFLNEADTPVTLGLGNSAEKIVQGVLFQIGSVWYTITNITGDGSGVDAVTFSGGTLGTATYDVVEFKSADADDNLQRCIDDAEAQIDGYLGACLTVPLTGADITEEIRRLTIDLAVWNLYTRKPQSFSRDEQYTPRVRYDNAIEKLEGICENPGSVGITPPPAANSINQPEIDNVDQHYKNDKSNDYYKSQQMTRSKGSGW